MTERRHSHSIRRRLLLALLATTLLVWGVTLFFSYRDTRHELDELLDAHLAQSASLLIAQIGHETDEIDLEHSPRLYHHQRKVAFQIWERGKLLLLHSASAPNVRLSPADKGFSDSQVGGKTWRVFSAWDDTRHFLIQIGERREARDVLAKTVARSMLLPLLVALPVLALLIWFSVARGLRPLQVLGSQVAVRHADNLAPIEAATAPDEVVPLVEGLNTLFARVRASIDTERGFTADAAHELRTPLAAIRTQAQVARAAGDDAERRRALDNVITGCDRTAHLMDQLLTLARLEPNQPVQCEAVNLQALVANVVAELAPAAIAKDVDLQLASHAAAPVAGSPGLLAMLVRNLIDNAIRYTPRHSAVEVAVTPTGDGAEFSVVDQGPGISEGEIDRVWDRFYRVLGSGATGSGLGLSIVKRIAELHGARVTLAPGAGGTGLHVRVRIAGEQAKRVYTLLAFRPTT
jgi:two-component system sensor histidine kinase QseC